MLLETWHEKEASPRISILIHLVGQTIIGKFLSRASSTVGEDEVQLFIQWARH